jgi:hypothetical protein
MRSDNDLQLTVTIRDIGNSMQISVTGYEPISPEVYQKLSENDRKRHHLMAGIHYIIQDYLNRLKQKIKYDA